MNKTTRSLWRRLNRTGGTTSHPAPYKSSIIRQFFKQKHYFPMKLSFFKEATLSSLSHASKAETGWIKAICLTRGLLVRELAEMAHVSFHQVYQSKRFESQNIFRSQYFQKVAEALEGRFEYVLILDKQPFPRSRSLVPLVLFSDHSKPTDG